MIALVSTPHPPPVPALVARRIAAQCSGAWSLMPTWLPQGFSYRRWDVLSHNVSCDLGPVVRFSNGSVALTWRSTDSRVEGTLPCNGRGFASHRLDRRRIFSGRIRGALAAWWCSNDKKISVTERAGGPTVDQLEHMVASARPLPPGRAQGSSYELVPVRDVRRVAKVFAMPLFLPRRLPGGFVFSDWNVVRRDSDTGGRRSLFVTFGREGPTIGWGVYAGTDVYGFDCPQRFADPSRVLHGRRIFYTVGAGHGASVWMCLAPRTVGNQEPLEVEAWYSASLFNPSFRRRMMELLATARLIRR